MKTQEEIKDAMDVILKGLEDYCQSDQDFPDPKVIDAFKQTVSSEIEKLEGFTGEGFDAVFTFAKMHEQITHCISNPPTVLQMSVVLEYLAMATTYLLSRMTPTPKILNLQPNKILGN